MENQKEKLSHKCMNISIRLIKKDIKTDEQLRKEIKSNLSKKDLLRCTEQFILEKTIEMVKTTDIKSSNDSMYM
jgi:hypothetical protein